MWAQSIIVAVIVLVAVGAGAWWILSDPVGKAARSAVEHVSNATTSVHRSETVVEQLPEGVGNLMVLNERGIKMECTFTYEHEVGSGEGSTFFDGERMRISGLYRENGQETILNYIDNGHAVFVWGSMPSREFTEQYEVIEGQILNFDEELSETAVLNQEVKYDCKEWQVDPSVFIPPANREFAL